MEVQVRMREWPLLQCALEDLEKGLENLVKAGEKLQQGMLESVRDQGRAEKMKLVVQKVDPAEKSKNATVVEFEDTQIIVTALEVHEVKLAKVADAQLNLTVEPVDTKESISRTKALRERMLGQTELDVEGIADRLSRDLPPGTTVEVTRG